MGAIKFPVLDGNSAAERACASEGDSLAGGSKLHGGAADDGGLVVPDGKEQVGSRQERDSEGSPTEPNDGFALVVNDGLAVRREGGKFHRHQDCGREKANSRIVLLGVSFLRAMM